MLSADQIDLLTLARTPSIGPITFYRLMDKYGSAAEALKAIPFLSKKTKIQIPNKAIIETEIKQVEKNKGQFLFFNDPLYPALLKQIEDAPVVLTCRGRLDLLQNLMVALVGSRNASLSGRKIASQLARDLGQEQITIVSGLARGIDTAAHEASLTSGTIAVVAGGVDVIYPKENENLYAHMINQGLVLSEAPWGQEPIATHFPKRNRIISGLSVATVIIEANLRSGSLITARNAAEQNRDVCAVPGSPADPRAEGPNQLIKDGACLVRTAQDVLEQIKDFSARFRMEQNKNQILQQRLLDQDQNQLCQENPSAETNTPDNIIDIILSNLGASPVQLDELARSCHVNSSVLQAHLLEIELEGRIQRLAGNRVVKLF
jgi:DNA processing protein